MIPKNNISISVILPTFNEAGHIYDLTMDIAKVLEKYGYKKYEVLVVDDSSSDGTGDEVVRASKKNKKIKLKVRKENFGLTASLIDGIKCSKNEIVIWMDADYSHPPEKIIQLLFMISEGFDVVVNSRYTIGGGEDREGKGGSLQLILSRILNWGIRFLLYPSFSDYSSGFIAIRRSVVEEYGLRGDYGEYFIDLIFRILKENKYKTSELPYFASPRRTGDSKTGTNLLQYMKRGRKYIYTVLKLRLGGA